MLEMDEWSRWLLMDSLASAGIALVALSVAAICVVQRLCRRRQAAWLALAVLPFFVGLLYAQSIPQRYLMGVQRIEMARELTVPLTEMRSFKVFPVDALASRVVAAQANQDQVRDLMRFARRRWVCRYEKVEKYLFFADEWGTMESDPGVLALVYYDEKDGNWTVRKAGVIDSADPVGGCSEW